MKFPLPESARQAADAWAARLFVPILAGATLRDRLIGCLGALLGIAFTAAVTAALLGNDPLMPFIVAPMGASAVLVFAIPASPLAQPWPVIGGNTLSALAGVVTAQLVGEPILAAALAVSLAIGVMSLTRSLHPPGGAAALTAVIGGASVTDAGYLFPFVPVGLNAVALVVLAVAFHRLTRRAYPHRPARSPENTHQTTDTPPAARVFFRDVDVDGALARMGETFDIDRSDLDQLLREVSLQAAIRQRGPLTCADVMSVDVISIRSDAPIDEARRLLLERNLRTLPVIDSERRVLGVVGLRQLASSGDVIDVTTRAATALAGDAALGLLPALTDGHTHAVVIVDDQRHLVGLVTQTDLLAAIGGLPTVARGPRVPTPTSRLA